MCLQKRQNMTLKYSKFVIMMHFLWEYYYYYECGYFGHVMDFLIWSWNMTG